MQKLKKITLWKKILIGIVIGLIIGFISPDAASFISPLGNIFLRLLKMLIVPLVFFSITSGICKMGDVKQLRSVGGRFVLYIVVTSSFLGIALLSLGEKVSGLVHIIDQGSETMMKITEYVMEYSPLGIMSLMATMVSTVSGAMMKEVLVFMITDNICALIILFVLYPLMVKLLAKISVGKFIKKISPAILVAISTTSSAATLPVSMKVSEEELGIPENVYGFTLPLGNTCGMNGFALFVGLCCIFASNLYGFPITFGGIVKFVFLGMILSIGAAGVKGAGVVMSTVMLETLGMPLTLIPILAAIWPTIDPAHTVLNNVGDLAGTTIIAKRLGKMNMETFNK
ncbi:MAG: dicarboxylate/amino acid:cation symporter [Caulobacteraceae bacterium]